MIAATFTVRHDPIHEARCVAAIRERWRREAAFKPLPWFRRRDSRGRFAPSVDSMRKAVSHG